MQQYIYIIFILLSVLGALVVLFSRNILYAALCLFFTFLGIAGVYVFASVDFLAITQLVIYVGGVLVLILFGIMLTNRVSSIRDLVSNSGNRLIGYLIGGGLFTLLIYGIEQLDLNASLFHQNYPGVSVIEPIGMSLMTDHILLFEIVGVLLLVVLVGAAYLVSNRSETH